MLDAVRKGLRTMPTCQWALCDGPLLKGLCCCMNKRLVLSLRSGLGGSVLRAEGILDNS